jgi:hypothetical protein
MLQPNIVSHADWALDAGREVGIESHSDPSAAVCCFYAAHRWRMQFDDSHLMTTSLGGVFGL